jgi:hypothetical protein
MESFHFNCMERIDDKLVRFASVAQIDEIPAPSERKHKKDPEKENLVARSPSPSPRSPKPPESEFVPARTQNSLCSRLLCCPCRFVMLLFCRNRLSVPSPLDV